MPPRAPRFRHRHSDAQDLVRSYREYQLASMRVVDDSGLAPVLVRLIEESRVRHVVETGTYLGTGSTRMLAEAFARVPAPETFVTIEANWSSWRAARENLERFPFVAPLWGLTVPRGKALDFVRTDDAIIHHERWPDVFIDDTRHPAKSYARELRGRLGAKPKRLRDYLQFFRDRGAHHQGDDLLARELRKVRDRDPLILLDSAGGIGWLEFQIMLETMGERSYTVVLDDTHHLKHFRSLDHIRRDPSFGLVAESSQHGWAVARHAARH